MLARFAAQHVEHGPFQFDRTFRRRYARFATNREFGQHDQIERPAVRFFVR